METACGQSLANVRTIRVVISQLNCGHMVILPPSIFVFAWITINTSLTYCCYLSHNKENKAFLYLSKFKSKLLMKKYTLLINGLCFSNLSRMYDNIYIYNKKYLYLTYILKIFFRWRIFIWPPFIDCGSATYLNCTNNKEPRNFDTLVFN